jgi:hypothetical protein
MHQGRQKQATTDQPRWKYQQRAISSFDHSMLRFPGESSLDQPTPEVLENQVVA